MFTRTLGRTIAIAAVLAAPLSAQQLTDQQTADLKAQTGLFTSILRGAVDKGTERLGQWAFQGNIQLVQTATPRISATPLPDGGLMFDVQIPVVYGMQLVDALQRQPGPGRPVAQGQNDPKVDPQALVSANLKPRCDPADPLTVKGEDQYSECMRQELINAVLDAAKVLTVKDGQWLVVGANNLQTNPIYANQSRRLILSIKGEDMRLLREKKITPEDAKKRIREERF